MNLLRHSGAIHRLRLTRHPTGIQAQLGHATLRMTMRYWKTLTAQESLEESQVGLEASPLREG